MKRIMIADDHAILRDGLEMIISTMAQDYSLAGSAGSFGDLREMLSKNRDVDILILDLSMPGGSGLEFLKEVKREYPNLAVLVLSFYPECEYGLRAFKCGASGYLCKECVSEELVNAIQTLAKGRRYFAKETDDLIFNELTKQADSSKAHDPHESLSDRELHVFLMIGKGKTVSEIAKDLSLSVKTVSTYRNRVMRKMNMTTNSQIIAYTVPRRLV